MEPAQSQTNADEAGIPAELKWATTEYLYDLTQGYYMVIQETNSNNSTTAYAYGLERIASYSADSKMEYVYDGRGSVAQTISAPVAGEGVTSVVPEIGIQVQSFSYTAFGEQMGAVKVSGFGYNAEAYDAATGMLNLRARQYEPAMNRFSQKDILRGTISIHLSMNCYLFVINNPICYLDPTGRAYTPANALALGKGPLSKQYYNQIMTKQEIEKPNIKALSTTYRVTSIKIAQSQEILIDAGKKYNKMSEKEKLVYNGAVTALNKVTNQKTSGVSVARKTEQAFQTVCTQLITEKYRTELTNAIEDFYRLINVDKLSSEYREMILNMVDMALLNDAQSGKDIADIIRATQMINTRSREIVILYEGAMKEQIRTVTNDGEYSFEKWISSDISTRESILNKYSQSLASIYGISVEAIIFEEYETIETGTGYGRNGTLGNKNYIGLNRILLNDERLYYTALDAIRHELRHIYQKAAINDPNNFLVQETVLNSWIENKNNYFDPYEVTDINAYYDQATEVDAREFASLD